MPADLCGHGHGERGHDEAKRQAAARKQQHVRQPQAGARRHSAEFAGAVAAGWLTVGGPEGPLSATRSMMIAPAASSASSTTTLSVAASAAELRELVGGCGGGH
ncbi:MAG TPA: hypothetical protein VII01_15825 [Solirubrobacteraceae bacterium]